jgi:hypothetical protein
MKLLKLYNPKALWILIGMVIVEYIGMYFAGSFIGEATVNFVDRKWGLLKNIEEEEAS